MPQLEDIAVHVTVDGVNGEGQSIRQPLEEWGVHRMRSSKKVSAYIAAETGKSFRVAIQPRIPYLSKDTAAAHEYNTRAKIKARYQGLQTERPGFFKMGCAWQDEDGNQYTPGKRPRYWVDSILHS